MKYFGGIADTGSFFQQGETEEEVKARFKNVREIKEIKQSTYERILQEFPTINDKHKLTL